MPEPSKKWLVHVVVDPRSARLNHTLTYASSHPLPLGQAVIVPLAKKDALAFVVACEPEPADSELFHRAVLDEIHGISLPPQLLNLIDSLARECLCSLSVALGAAIPSGLRDRLATVWALNNSSPTPKLKKNELRLVADREEKLPPLHAQVIQILEDAGGQLVEKPGQKWEPGVLRTLLALAKTGRVSRKLTFLPLEDSARNDKVWQLNPHDSEVEEFLKGAHLKKPAQALALIALQQASADGSRPEFTSGDIKAMAGVTDAVIKSLASQGMLVEVKTASHVQVKAAPTPNPYQAEAIQTVSQAVKSKVAKTFLLFGVTGSGKTEVYLRAASTALESGRQVLYLVPEIAIAAQGIGRIRERFGDKVTVLHSELAAGERLNSFHQIRSGQAPIVLGARSGLFAPLDNIGLIIMDEEHEGAYKQDVEPRYHTKNAAKALAQLHQCPLILGSATPSIETFYEAEQGEIERLDLPIRAAEAQLPEVITVDLTEGFRQHHPRIISPELADLLSKTLVNGEQAIFFLNRRAYTPFLICRGCGRRWGCPRCSVTLSFHKYEQILKCHHCGYAEVAPGVCPDCGDNRIAPIGLGTEKVEEALRELHPLAHIERLDRDITSKKGRLEAILSSFRSGETQILVGTQMVAKGLDFPGVTLVGVIAADTSINLPDYRSSERAFQLLSQVSGRAGRGDRPGKVVIQTFQAGHPSVQCAKTHDYLGFYELLKNERLAASYPPFVRIVNVVCAGEDRDRVIAKADELAEKLVPFGEVLGPADCSIERIRDKYRRHVFVKLPRGASVEPLKEVVPPYPDPKVSVVFDVDPNSMM